MRRVLATVILATVIDRRYRVEGKI